MSLWPVGPRLAAGPLLALLLGATAAVGQSVRGRVVDPATGPLAGANISFRLADGSDSVAAVSDSAGIFRAQLPRAGSWAMTVARIGYDTEGPSSLAVPGGRELEVLVRLGARALQLPPLEVQGTSRPLSGLEEVNARIERMRALGVGRSFTRSQIEQLNPQNVGSVLRALSAQVRVTESPQMIVNTIFLRGGPRAGGSCAPAVYIDGFRVNQRPTNVNLLIEPRHIEAVELYIGGAQVPIGFHDPEGCGSVLIWSRRGTPAEGTPHQWRRYAIAAGLVLGAVMLFK